jgi:hypothetical protein
MRAKSFLGSPDCVAYTYGVDGLDPHRDQVVSHHFPLCRHPGNELGECALVAVDLKRGCLVVGLNSDVTCPFQVRSTDVGAEALLKKIEQLEHEKMF